MIVAVVLFGVIVIQNIENPISPIVLIPFLFFV